jgi:N-glycosylase/DNA lyase
MVKSLCSHYSPPLMSVVTPTGADDRETYHPFPPPSVLAAPEVASTLRNLGFGYRADFIQKTAKMLVDEHGVSDHSKFLQEPAERWLAELRVVSVVEARAELLKLMGVGRKVADCVLLMSLDKVRSTSMFSFIPKNSGYFKRGVVPVDTHVHQIAHKHYGVRMTSPTKGGKVTMTPKLYDEVSTKLTEVWGEYAGWAHSVRAVVSISPVNPLIGNHRFYLLLT